MGLRSIFIAIVAVVAIGTGTWLSYMLAKPPATTVHATLLPTTGDIAEFSLLDPQSRTIGPGAFVGQWDLVFFGFTHCPDICPLTLQVLSSARQQLADAGQDPLPRIVLVSVDPERDTPAKMGEYVGYFGDDILGITGELTELRKLTASLGIFFEKSSSDADNYGVDHSAVVLVVNPRGKLHALFSAPHKVENFVNDLPIIMADR